MKIERSPTETLTITGAPALDTITVFLQDFEPGRGMITVCCYGLAWSAFFGAMGNGKSIREFVDAVPTDYLAGKLWRSGDKPKKADEAYLLRIVNAVVAAVKETAQ
jgi:hypothetical protein